MANKNCFVNDTDTVKICVNNKKIEIYPTKKSVKEYGDYGLDIKKPLDVFNIDDLKYVTCGSSEQGDVFAFLHDKKKLLNGTPDEIRNKLEKLIVPIAMKKNATCNSFVKNNPELNSRYVKEEDFMTEFKDTVKFVQSLMQKEEKKSNPKKKKA